MTPVRTRLMWLALAPVLALELFAASLVWRSDVNPAYRAYYIDQSTDCWKHVTAAPYVLGTTLSFVARHEPLFFPNKICGWYYPSPRGTWSYGDFSLLRFTYTPTGGALRLTLAAGAMVDADYPRQRVVVSVNGAELATLDFAGSDADIRTVDIPAAIAAAGRIDLRFDYPDAGPGREMGPNEDSHPRAIRMVALTLAAAATDAKGGDGPPPPPRDTP
ncbi:MAG: hypothetical protein P4M09_03605 [Devosia sp.]|nr:hypothetical protein [Devosia sp.]